MKKKKNLPEVILGKTKKALGACFEGIADGIENNQISKTALNVAYLLLILAALLAIIAIVVYLLLRYWIVFFIGVCCYWKIEEWLEKHKKEDDGGDDSNDDKKKLGIINNYNIALEIPNNTVIAKKILLYSLFAGTRNRQKYSLCLVREYWRYALLARARISPVPLLRLRPFSSGSK